MIIINKKVFFPVLALAIIGAALIRTNFVSAQDTTGTNSLVTAIAQKFNLNTGDVQAVFDEERSKREADIKAEQEQKLTQAVTDGKITEAQKQAILTKFSQPFTMKVDKSQMENMTEDQMKAMHEQRKTEMDTWLSQNGLTQEVLNDVLGHPKGFGHGKAGMFKH